jgi:YD repeat-containing protein
MFKTFTFVLSLLTVTSVFSGVNLKNGNFYISYSDVVSVSRGKTMASLRTYNSKSTGVGWFGFGWGSLFEVRLEESSDGSVVIHENGTAGKTRFTPKSPITAQSTKQVAKRIIAAIQAKAKMSPKAAEDLEKVLVNNSDLRHKMGVNNGVFQKIKPGTVLYSTRNGKEELHVVKKGYKRVLASGGVQLFDTKGRLFRTKMKNGYGAKLKYNKAGNVTKIADTVGNQLFLEWYPSGRVKSVSTKGKMIAKFKYDGLNLVESIDMNKVKFTYKYDGHHNLIAITDHSVKDKKAATYKVEYEPKTFFTKKVTKRDGSATHYRYGNDKANKELHYWTTVIKQGLDGTPFANKYEYRHQKRADGSQWLEYTKFVTGANYDFDDEKMSGGLTRETWMTECCGLPLKITQGDRVTRFKYDGKGRMTRKEQIIGKRTSVTQLKYHASFDKITEVRNDNKEWTKFEYNKKGELKKALNHSGQAVLLLYNREGKITKMVDQNQKSKKRKIFAFKYNAQGKPVEIRMDKVGLIKLAYDNAGQVKKVDSNKGPTLAYQVTEAFQNLLAIVRPAGVNLNI